MNVRHIRVLLFLILLAALSLPASGCAPRRIEASSQGFSGSGIADFNIRVSPPLTLTLAGRATAAVPSDDALQAPIATMAFALFAEGGSGAVTRHAHTIFSELPRQAWRWEMETWAKREALLYATERAGGKDWTIQIFPVAATGDWISALWQKNGRQTPDLWLAKRWSSTPEEEMRLLAEYREPLPACLRDNLGWAAGENGPAPLPRGKDLRRGCEREIKEFSTRADAVFDLEKRSDTPPAAPEAKTALLPDMRPDMPALVGRAEAIMRLSDNR